MSFIKKKRDRRNYETVKFFMAPQKLIVPNWVDSEATSEGHEVERGFDRDVEEAKQRILRIRRERGIG